MTTPSSPGRPAGIRRRPHWRRTAPLAIGILLTALSAAPSSVAAQPTRPADERALAQHDNYAPTSDRPRNIAKEMQKKVDKGQTDRIVLNLSDSPVDLGEMSAQLHDWPIKGLKEVTVIDRQGNVIHFYP